MVEMGHTARAGLMSRFGKLFSEWRGSLRDYLAAISGSGGRLVFSLAYFVALANSLSLDDFGRFAAASAAGVVLSRITAFGFTTALYRTATLRPRLIGTFTGGYLAMLVLSLPVLATASFLVHLAFFSGQMGLSTYAKIVLAEALLWRPLELVAILNNGLNRFGRASVLVVAGIGARALAALLFALLPAHPLETWADFYVAANLAALVFAVTLFYPRQRLRFFWPLYLRRLPDSLYIAGAEAIFYLQSELDKVLVLSLAGPKLAGIYAIIMRLADLTAIPVRVFTMMLSQRMMRRPALLARWTMRAGIEAAIFAVSTLGLLALAAVLHLFPNALGHNVAGATALLIFAAFVPGLRNLPEYQAELLFARGQTLVRALNLALLAGLKAVLLVWVLGMVADGRQMIVALNWMFAILYAASALLTYSAMRMPAKAV